MRANYHSHTVRCHHAAGTEREYVERAVEGGLSILGFSDHTPYIYDKPGFVSPVRMLPEELTDYVAVLEGLRGEYGGRLEVRIGLEAEYFPRLFSRLLELARGAGVEYLILGQHFLDDDCDGGYTAMPTADRQFLDRYVSQSIEGLQTGCFTYFAHPDVIHFTGGKAEYDRQMRRLCRAAKDCGVPLEINLLGLREGRHYPDLRFWRVAAEEGNPVVLGSDAHRPRDVWDPETERRALEIVDSLGLPLLETVELRRL